MKLSKLIEELDAKIIRGNPDAEISGLDSDSRKIQPGGLFIAIRGFETDGHRYIAAAVSNGASAVAVEEGAEYDDAAVPEGVTLLSVAQPRRFLALAACRFFPAKRPPPLWSNAFWKSRA